MTIRPTSGSETATQFCDILVAFFSICGAAGRKKNTKKGGKTHRAAEESGEKNLENFDLRRHRSRRKRIARELRRCRSKTMEKKAPHGKQIRKKKGERFRRAASHATQYPSFGATHNCVCNTGWTQKAGALPVFRPACRQSQACLRSVLWTVMCGFSTPTRLLLCSPCPLQECVCKRASQHWNAP